MDRDGGDGGDGDNDQLQTMRVRATARVPISRKQRKRSLNGELASSQGLANEPPPCSSEATKLLDVYFPLFSPLIKDTGPDVSDCGARSVKLNTKKKKKK